MAPLQQLLRELPQLCEKHRECADVCEANSLRIVFFRLTVRVMFICRLFVFKVMMRLTLALSLLFSVQAKTCCLTEVQVSKVFSPNSSWSECYPDSGLQWLLSLLCNNNSAVSNWSNRLFTSSSSANRASIHFIHTFLFLQIGISYSTFAKGETATGS